MFKVILLWLDPAAVWWRRTAVFLSSVLPGLSRTTWNLQDYLESPGLPGNSRTAWTPQVLLEPSDHP